MQRMIFILVALALAETRPAEESATQKAFSSAGSYVYTDNSGKLQTVQYTSDDSGIKITSTNVPPEDVPKIIQQIQNQMNFMPFFPMFSFGFPFGKDLKDSENTKIQDEEEAPFVSTIHIDLKMTLKNPNEKQPENIGIAEETNQERKSVNENQELETTVLDQKKKGKMMAMPNQKLSEFICIPNALRPCDDDVIINITDNKNEEETSQVEKEASTEHPTESLSDDLKDSTLKTVLSDFDDSKPYPAYIMEDKKESNPVSEEEDLESNPYPAPIYLAEEFGDAAPNLHDVDENPTVYASKVQHNAIHDFIKSFIENKEN